LNDILGNPNLSYLDITISYMVSEIEIFEQIA